MKFRSYATMAASFLFCLSAAAEGSLLLQKSWFITGGATCAKQEDGSLLITRKQGDCALLPDSYCPVEPGKSYRVRWIVEAPKGIRFHVVTHTPPRTPWPAGSLKSGTGKPVTVDQILTIRTGESKIRPQLAFSGMAGNVTIKELCVTELSEEELRKGSRLDEELLPQRSWILTAGATSARQEDGSLLITKKKGEAVLLPDGFVSVAPGKSYRIRWIVEAPQGSSFRPVTYTPPRTPWPSGTLTNGTGSDVTVDQILAIRTGESKIRPQLAIFGVEGKVTVKDLRVTELLPEELKETGK